MSHIVSTLTRQFMIQFTSAVSWKGLPLRHETGPLCGTDTLFPVYLGPLKVADVNFHGMPCQSQNLVGAVQVHYSVKLAQWLPPGVGNSAFKMMAQSTNGDKLFCLKVKIAIDLLDSQSNATNPVLGSFLAPLAQAGNAIIGNNNSNGHDNGVNVNVNVLGIQDKENVESANGGNIHGDGNMNGHDNGVNVNVNVLGIQRSVNAESANVAMGGDDKWAIREMANILKSLANAKSHSGQLRPKPHACLSQLAYEARIVKSCGGCTFSRSLLRLVATVSSWQRLRNIDHGSIILKQLGFISIPDLFRIVYRSLLSCLGNLELQLCF